MTLAKTKLDGALPISGNELMRLRISFGRMVNANSNTQQDFVRACAEDFSVKCEITTSESARRSGVLEHLYNLSVH